MPARSPSFRVALTSVAAVLFIGLVWVGCARDESELTAPRDQVVPTQELLAPALDVQERHTDHLMADPDVVGTGVGLNVAGDPVIKIYTRRPGVEGLPQTLDGVPVAVEVTGMFVARSDPTARFPRPVPIGVSTGHPDITAGTIGARVTDGTNVFALSNNHVYANSNDANIGDSALQPGPYDGGQDPEDKIGELYDFEPIAFDGSDNTIDAAIAISSTSELDVATPEDGYGTPSATTTSASVDMQVQKFGRTTGLTHGKVSEVSVTVDVCYECAGPFCFNCKKLARFVDQIAITPGDFSGGGDSGSLIVTDNNNNNNPSGLLFAGSDTRTLANPIDAVLNRFNVTIDDGTPLEPVTDIAVTGVSAPSSAVQGDMVNVDVTVENVGNQDVTSDINVTLTDVTDAVTIGTQTISGGLTAGASTTLSYSWDTSGSTIGDHTLTASHDFTDDDASNDSKSTTVTVNEPSAGVSVTGIDPNSMQAGTTIDVTITGSGFEAGADVTFENGSGPTPSASNIVVVDASTITATVTAKSGGPPRDRVWDVRVTNPDGSSGVLVGGFTVTP